MDLSQFDTEYDNAKIESSEVPDGKYQVIVFDLEIGEGDYGPFLNWKLKILTGSQSGRFIFHRRKITNDSIKFIKMDLMACGYTKSFSELPETMDSLVGVTLEIKKTTKEGSNGKSYSNVYFVKQITVAEEDYGF